MTLPANGNAPLNNPSHFTEHVGLPRGIVAYKIAQSAPGGNTVAISTTAAEILRVTNVPLSAGRLYVFTVLLRAFSLAANGHLSIRTPGTAVIAGTTLQFDVLCPCVGALNSSAFASVPFTVSADGSYTFPVQVVGTGTGTAFVDIVGTHLRIEDIGPVRGGQ